MCKYCDITTRAKRDSDWIEYQPYRDELQPAWQPTLATLGPDFNTHSLLVRERLHGYLVSAFTVSNCPWCGRKLGEEK